MEEKFIPVKFTGRKWAERLVHGEVFMRALHEFGSWGNLDHNRDEAVNNHYRGDFFAGVTETFENPDDSPFFSGFPEDVKQNITYCSLIDFSDVQYFKIFSMYCMEQGKLPDSRMKEFGDTAVMFLDFCSFLERFGKAVSERFDAHVSLIDRIQPFSFNKTQKLNPMFCKHEGQAYQNELRLALGELRKNPFSVALDGRPSYPLVHDLEALKIQVGDISDITMIVDTDDLLSGRVTGFKCKWPSNPENPTNYDLLRNETKIQMSHYESTMVKPTFVMI